MRICGIATWLILTWISLPLDAAETGYFQSALAIELRAARLRASDPDSMMPQDGISIRYDFTRPPAKAGLSPWKIADKLMKETATFPALPSRFEQRLSAAVSDAPKERIRTKVINWIKQYNETTGRLSDFMLPGSDLPLHLEVDPGDKEIILEWNLQF